MATARIVFSVFHQYKAGAQKCFAQGHSLKKSRGSSQARTQDPRLPAKHFTIVLCRTPWLKEEVLVTCIFFSFYHNIIKRSWKVSIVLKVLTINKIVNLPFNSLPHNPDLDNPEKETSWKTLWEKGENVGNLFSQSFLPFPKQISIYQSHLFCRP